MKTPHKLLMVIACLLMVVTVFAPCYLTSANGLPPESEGSIERATARSGMTTIKMNHGVVPTATPGGE